MDEKIKQTTPVPSATEKTPVAEAKTETKNQVPEEQISNDPEASKANPLLDGHYRENPFFYEVAEYFNIPQKDFDEAAPKLGVIVDYVCEKYGIKAPEDALLKIRELNDMVQPPHWDEKRYANLYKYLMLASRQLSLGKAMKAFERNPNGKSN